MRLMTYLGQRRWGLLVALATLLADAGSKGWVVTHQDRLPVTVVPHLCSLVLAWNRGMSFSFLSRADLWWGPWLLGGLALLAAGWFVHWMGEARADGQAGRLHVLGLGLLTGGALGNVLDRVVHGAVVDFLLFYGRNWYFPVFNGADSAISVGVALLLWDSVRRANVSKKEEAGHA